MEAPRDLCLTKDQVLCEFGSPESAVVFHRKGQVITPQEDLLYGVTAYLERTTRERERAERIATSIKQLRARTEPRDEAAGAPR